MRNSNSTMMKYIKLVLALSIVVIIVCCSKKETTFERSTVNGIMITRNNGNPADPEFRIELKEIGQINMENVTDSIKFLSSIADVTMDKDGSLFIIDYMKCKIHKYDKNCNFIKTFGRKGNGPGEFEYVTYMNIREDTIFVPNVSTMMIMKYDTAGNFIENKRLYDISKFPMYPEKFGEKYISQTRDFIPDEEKGIVFYETISLYDSDFMFEKHLYINEYSEVGAEPEDLIKKGHRVAFNDSNIFGCEVSIDNYFIDVFNNNGIKKRQIQKNYRRTKSDEDSYVNSIQGMQTDKYGRLWVGVHDVNFPGKRIYDIYDNDIFINRVTLDIEKGYFGEFIEDKFVAINRDTNSIKVYEYEEVKE
ncbi:TPA: hypothetical protein DCR49_12410 [Candidatus Delongbacteria bacterium]|nr:MAG: hypothetical protein A2Y39_06220 [Candidatus Delongbacteria bacterium GWF2_40_14]HAQ62770.1 hypothetical protein [Candidatus Delongbacteria bacterium]